MTCAVVNVDADSVIQRTMYYASGVPMAQSFGRDKQPYLYNGKEFVEAHDWNTYDYGFRGYYAPIGRFTSIDPLAEQTPWQSPYAYANNNFINAIDWMGLGGMTGFNNSPDICQYIVIDSSGDYLGGVDNDDWSIYIDPDGRWNPEDGIDGLERVGLMMFPFWVYENWIGKGNKAPGLYYEQWRVSASISFGLNFEVEYNLVKIHANYFSFDELNLTFSSDDMEFNWRGKDNRIDVSHGIGLSLFGYGAFAEQSFKIYASDLEYVPGTTNNILGLTFPDANIGSSFDGNINISIGISVGLGFTLVLSGNIYYQGQND